MKKCVISTNEKKRIKRKDHGKNGNQIKSQLRDRARAEGLSRETNIATNPTEQRIERTRKRKTRGKGNIEERKKRENRTRIRIKQKSG